MTTWTNTWAYIRHAVQCSGSAVQLLTNINKYLGFTHLNRLPYEKLKLYAKLQVSKNMLCLKDAFSICFS